MRTYTSTHYICSCSLFKLPTLCLVMMPAHLKREVQLRNTLLPAQPVQYGALIADVAGDLVAQYEVLVDHLHRILLAARPAQQEIVRSVAHCWLHDRHLSHLGNHSTCSVLELAAKLRAVHATIVPALTLLMLLLLLIMLLWAPANAVAAAAAACL